MKYYLLYNPIILSCLYYLYLPCILHIYIYIYLHTYGYMCTIVFLDIRTHGEQVCDHQVFGGLWTFRGLITVGTYLEYTDPGSFVSDVDPVYMGVLGLELLLSQTRWLATAIWRFSSQERNRWHMLGSRGEFLAVFATPLIGGGDN